VKAINCTQCRKKQFKEAEEAFLKQQYVIYKDMSYTFAVLSTAAVLGVMCRRGRRKKYIQELFKEICFMYQYPAVMGKQVTLTDLLKTLEKDYGINFAELTVNVETEKEFITSAKKGIF
jgi:hypothetical protein